jgi:L-lysine exporter family protein LysE/ArgO
MTDAFGAGLGLSLSLIVAIGAQNSFVLRQGLRREHVLLGCLICALSDAVLILAGISGLALAIGRMPALLMAIRYFGVLFLAAYGVRSFWRAWGHADQLMPSETESKSLGQTALICLALTWLNPHVYLDTVLLVGSIAQNYPDHKPAFALGAMTASLVFFFALGYGATLLRPLLAKPLAWRILELLIGLCMWAIAASLLLQR